MTLVQHMYLVSLAFETSGRLNVWVEIQIDAYFSDYEDASLVHSLVLINNLIPRIEYIGLASISTKEKSKKERN